MKKITALPLVAKILAGICILAIAGAAATGIMYATRSGVGPEPEDTEQESTTQILASLWPSVFETESYVEPPFADDPNRTNNAFNVQDFGPQGTNGWFYRYGRSSAPHRSQQITGYEGERYFQPGCNGLEIKSTFLHTAENAAPILEWRVAQDGAVNVAVTYVKNVNGDKNPSYPDGVQLLVYKGEELLKLENVDISVTEENLAEISIENLAVTKGESLYFAVDPRANNAFDGGSLYIGISDVNAMGPAVVGGERKNNNANSVTDFGPQGSNGWQYLYGTSPADVRMVSHENEGQYTNATSPNLSISSGFIHPSLNHNAVLGWIPAVSGEIDLRLRYAKFEQHDGNPDFPDGVKVRVFKNDDLLFEQHLDAPAEGENKIAWRLPKLAVNPTDRLYFMVDPEGNSSYDGGAFDVTIIDINGATDETDISVDEPEIRQNFADVKADFGPQGSNGWFFQMGYGDDPFHAYNMSPFHQSDDRYFESSYLEIKRDYANPGEHDRSPVIKWKVAQNGKVKIRASYTKMKNEDKNPDWPDGTRVSIYLNETLLRQETFAPEVDREVTKRLDVDSLSVRRGDYITMVINSMDNNAYDGGQYEFAISSISGLVGKTEKDVRPWYDGKRTNFASTKDDFNGEQGYNGWYYQFGYYCDPFFAVNVERCENDDKFYTSDGVEIKKDFIVPGNKGKSANVKWVAAKGGRVNIDLEYTKLRNEDANPSWPDGVTVYLMRNNTVLSKEYFAPLTSREVTKSLAVDNVKVNKGDCITMIVDPGENNAYDGGKYMFVIEDADETPKVKVGNYDNNTSLTGLTSMKQGTDGWWFLEGKTPSGAKVLTKLNADGNSYGSRRTDGLEMRKDFVHTGDTRDPIYQWVVGKNGKIDIVGTYVKYGQEDSNRNWPDGVTVKIWHNNSVIFTRKVSVKRGDGNNNAIGFDLPSVSVKRGDKLSFQICADGNYAWDGGQLCAQITPTTALKVKAGNDNSTSLMGLDSMKQGTDGWWFLEGTSPAKARLLTEKTADGEGYVSLSTPALEMKRDYVHTGAARDPIYLWVVAKDGKVDIDGSYVKFGQEDSDPSRPDGVTLTIWQNNTRLKTQKVKVLRGDGNNNAVSFSLEGLSVKAGDKICFQIAADKNNGWDAGALSVAIEPTSTIKKVNKGDNSTSLSGLSDKLEQGEDGWYFMEGTTPAKAKLLSKHTEDGEGFVSTRTSGLEMKKAYVHTGATLDPIYQWVVAADGKLDVAGTYVKFGQNDANPKWPDGVTLTIWHNNKKLKSQKVTVKQGDGNNTTYSFSFDALTVKQGDTLSFQISADSNNAWDGGSLSVAIEPVSTMEKKPGDDNFTVLGKLTSVEQGTDGWYFLEGTTLKDAKPLTNLSEDKSAYRSGKDAALEMKKDYVHPGAVQNPIYQWVVKADQEKLDVKGKFVKYGQNDENPALPDGIVLTIWHNETQILQQEVKALQGDGNDNVFSFDFTGEKGWTVKANDTISFQISCNKNTAWDAGRLEVTIGAEPELVLNPGDDNNTNLKDNFGAQGNDGWYYGMCDWDSTGFELLSYDAENARYYNDGKPELKADFVEPGNGKNAAYVWVVAEDGTIQLSGQYVKFVNNPDPEANGTCVRIFLNGVEKKWMGTTGNFDADQTVSFNETYEVKRGDILTFAVNPEGNDSYDGGRLEVTIASTGEPEPETYKPGDDNNTNLKANFGAQGSDGWYYGFCDWDGANFTKLPYDAENSRYFEDGKPELKSDWAAATGGNAAYLWVAAKDGKVQVKFDFTKTAGAKANVRCRIPSVEGDHYTGVESEETVTVINDTFDVKKGDKLLFQFDGDGAQGRPEVTISEVEETGDEETYKPGDDNNTNLKANFGAQGSDGWYYGFCDWDGANFTKLPYDAENSRYFEDGKPELKSDWAAATGGNAAYLWVAAKDGKVQVKFDFTKTAGAKANVRCRIPSVEGDHFTGVESGETVTVINDTFDVKKGDKLLFQFDGDGAQGRPEVTISEVTGGGSERTNSTVLADDFSGKQGENGWYYGMCDWDSKNFSELTYDSENGRYYNSGKPELKADFVEPGNGRNAAYKWVAAQDGTIRITGTYYKFANSDDAGADGTCVRIFLNGTEKKWMGGNGVTQGTLTEEHNVSFDETYEIHQGDEVIFAVNPEGNDSYDGGRLEVTITPAT